MTAESAGKGYFLADGEDAAETARLTELLNTAAPIVLGNVQELIKQAVNLRAEETLMNLQTCLSQMLKDASECIAAGKYYAIDEDEGEIKH